MVVVKNEQKANEAERTGHLGEEDVIEEEVKVEDFPLFFAEFVGGEERNKDSDY